MIYFVDEDLNQVRPFRLELSLRNYEVKHILDADDALSQLSSAKDIELVLLDIMLSANPNKAISKFSREQTLDYTLTGILLLEELIEENPQDFPKKAVLFSMASTERLLSKIKAASKQYSIPFIKKSQFPTPYEFGNEIEKILDDIRRNNE